MKALRETKDGPFCIQLSKSDAEESGVEPLKQLLKEAVQAVNADPRLEVQIDFGSEALIPSEFLRQITVAGIALRHHGKKFTALHISDSVRRQIIGQGLDGLFVFSTPQEASRTIDVLFVNPFIQGAIETLEVQCGSKASASGAVSKKAFKKDYTVELMAIIGLTSNSFTGSIALCFPSSTFLTIMERMLGEPCQTITDEIRDGAGELLNIIFGVAKVKLNEAGLKVEKAIPSVVHGKDIELRHTPSDLAIVLSFQSTAGPFYMEIGHENHAPAKAA